MQLCGTQFTAMKSSFSTVFFCVGIFHDTGSFPMVFLWFSRFFPREKPFARPGGAAAPLPTYGGLEFGHVARQLLGLAGAGW